MRYFLPLPIIDEVDGNQHFAQVMDWKSPEDTQHIDAAKITLAIENGHHVRRHVQEDVWNERVDWRAWIAKTGAILCVTIVPTLCLPLPRSQWEPLLSKITVEVPVVFI